jgi:hypothetical protein
MVLSALMDAPEARGVAFIGLNRSDEVFFIQPINVL